MKTGCYTETENESLR